MQPGNNRATINLLHCLILLRASGTETIYVPEMRNIDFQTTYLAFFICFWKELSELSIKIHLDQFLQSLVFTEHLYLGILLGKHEEIFLKLNSSLQASCGLLRKIYASHYCHKMKEIVRIY